MKANLKTFWIKQGSRILVGGLLLIWIMFLGVTVQAQERGKLDLLTGITQVSKQAIPAVVHVEVTQKTEVSNPLYPFERDPSLRKYFNLPKGPKKFKREVTGLGTGILIDASGSIVTNSHVVDSATKIMVVLADGRQFTARLIGTDPKTDLAVIKIAAKESFPFLKFGDSDKVEVGEWVVAIGHPRGLDQTVTAGIISAKHRRGISDPSSYQDFLQTDAAINPGNSGGPLLDLSGQVIGVNSAIASASGGFEGIGFAIPSNMVTHIVRALMAYGKVERGWLGVSVQDLPYERAKALGLQTPKGALVSEVMKSSPAEKAGIQLNDIILQYRNTDISDSSDLRNRIATTTIGENVRLTVWRKGKKIDLTARIGNLETAYKIMADAVKERLGADLRPLTAKELEKYGIDSKVGVAVASLAKNSPLKEAGLEINDVILGANGQMIESLDSLTAVISSVPPNQQITLLVLDHRTGDTGTVEIKLK